MSEIEQRVRHFVVESFLFGNETEAPKSDTSFLEARLIDSTGVLELVHFLEMEFEIKVADDELVPDNLDSLKKIAEFVARKHTN